MQVKNGQANIYNGLTVTGSTTILGVNTFSGINTLTGTDSTNVISTVSSTPMVLNAAGSSTTALELQTTGTRRLRILSTAASTTFEASNTSGFVMNSSLNIQGFATASAVSITGAASGSLRVSGSTAMVGSGSTILSIDGSSGRLFSVDDSLSGSLFSVNTAAGLPVMEAFSDNTVRVGQYGTLALFVSKSRVGIGKESGLNANLDVLGTAIVSGSAVGSPAFYVTNGGVQFGSTTGFVWDAANSRLGIGTSSPSNALTVQANSGDDGITLKSNVGTTIFQIKRDGNSTNTAELFQYAAGAIRLAIRSTANMSYFNGGNFAFGATTDDGYRLDVNGSGSASGGFRVVNGATLLVGAGNTSATNALLVQNSDGTSILKIGNDRTVTIGIAGGAMIVNTNSTTVDRMTFQVVRDGVNPNFFVSSVYGQNASGTYNIVSTPAHFQPTSGTAVYNTLVVNPTVNQTGGANGITRGLYVAPTLTAAADWRSIEWANNSGYGIYGAGTANNYIGGSLGIGTTSLTGFSLCVSKNITGSVFGTGIAQNGIVQSDVTSTAFGIINTANSVNSAFSFAYSHFAAAQGTIGASSTLSTQTGFLAASSMNTGSSIYGFRGQIVSGSGRWNMYMDGTADNHLSGKLLIGTNTDSGYKLDVSGSTRVQGTLYLGTGATKYLDVAASDALWNTSLRVNANFWANTQMMVGNYSSINSSAALQIESTTKGFLPPRMTGAQAESIASPAEGLMVYATDSGSGAITSKGWWGYDGATWVKLN